ncbi:head-tail connector protein [Mesorhizobium sp.]|uniref:head-tail connector protein n=1 Tax=Mesorhizobium sp. TaxID=1871066 RepID=UPI0012243087|nr:head-tail connector protein [Mesorhizobium sp.]TIN82643.1 MAG: hypothetical protein E5X97_29220 [Mesorhizobium sp.]
MLRTVTPSAADPVSLAEAKKHLRVVVDDDDTLIEGLISAARSVAEDYVQRRFVEQTVEWVLNDWHCGDIRLPIAPVAKDGVTSVKYIDMDGNEQTLSTSLYVVQTWGHSVRIIPSFGAVWPLVLSASPEPIVIRFTVGVAVDKVAPNVKAAINLMLGHLYENRESVVIGAIAMELPQSSQMLLLSEVW